MGYFHDWTAQDVADKADSEGGIYGIIQWGGAEVFECLGAEAVALAEIAEKALRTLSSMLPEPGEGEDW